MRNAAGGWSSPASGHSCLSQRLLPTRRLGWPEKLTRKAQLQLAFALPTLLRATERGAAWSFVKVGPDRRGSRNAALHLLTAEGYPALSSFCQCNPQVLDHAVVPAALVSSVWIQADRVPTLDLHVCVSIQAEPPQGMPAPPFCTPSPHCMSRHVGCREDEKPNLGFVARKSCLEMAHVGGVFLGRL